MSKTSATAERQGFFLFLNLYRWINWVLALLLLLLGAIPEVSLATNVIIYAAVFVYNGFFTLFARQIEAALRRRPALLVFDGLFCFSLLLAYGWGSPFYMYSLSPVMLAGLVGGLRAAFVMAAFGAAAYPLSVSLNSVNGKVWADIAELGEVDTHLFQMFDYFLIAIFFSYPAVLAERLRRSNKELQDAQAQVESLVLEKERERLAGQIHDSVTQLLLGVNLLIDDALKKSAEPAVIERLRLAKEATGKAIQQARLAVEDLFEERLSSRPFSEIVREVIEQAGDLHEIKVALCAEGVEPELPGEVKKVLYFIVQELAGNIIKHAEATEIVARVLFTKEKIAIQISDNGQGFERKNLEFGYGLSTISSRIRQLKGTFSLEPGEDGGATALIEVPTSALLA